jgi:dTDP-4-dehydrorhamnose 3,5-epimerase-like enzyme
MLQISSTEHQTDLAIDGLRFEKNAIAVLDQGHSWFSHKVISSPGPLVSDFVTHGPDFHYSTYGIHIGQVDRLTFFGHHDRNIIGHFIDCRSESPTRHVQLSYSFAPRLYRRLVIPRGVAHTFDGLAGIVTRDEPIWYASEDNPHWNVHNDLISILRSTTDNFPTVDVCKYRFSDDMHNFMTRLSQSVLEKPRAYSTRFKLRIGGVEQYVMFQETTWDNEGQTLKPLLDVSDSTPIGVHPSKYAITGKASWTLVPNTLSGVADVLLMPSRTLENTGMNVHRRTRRWYTFLTQEGSTLEVETLDLRPSSPTFGMARSFSTFCDPRITYVVDPGIAYRFAVNDDIFVRAENEVFVSEHEPRDDIPMFGNDLEVIDPGNFSREQPELPSLQCSERVIRNMAKHEGSSVRVM